MHIEPGILSSAKIAFANVAAVGMLAAYAPALIKRPALLLRTALAAVFFSIFMQVFHMPVGASELHFVGAMPIYLLLGFVPTLFGFALGLLLQGLLFDPQDLAHLAVNSLSLMMPLAAVHYGLGKHIAGKLTVANIVKLDFTYYAGVTLMVGFWLSMGTEPTPLANWATFAASYLALVLVEPLVTLAVLRTVRAFKNSAWAQLCLDERVTAHVAAGKPVWAECGGMMLLFERLTQKDGSTQALCGLLPGEVTMQPRLAALGSQQLDWGIGTLRGHTFHHSRCNTPLEPLAHTQRPSSGENVDALYRHGSIMASYFHAWFASQPKVTAALFSC